MPTAARQPDLPYRVCVGVMLLNSRREIWIGRRQPRWIADKSRHIWQMPQGGVCAEESLLEAARRELVEETGVTSVEVVGEIGRWLTYDLPEHLVGVALKGRYRGQRQRWFAMRFVGEDQEIRIEPPAGTKAEFNAWQWARPKEILDLALPFKRSTYEAVLEEFAHLLDQESEQAPPVMTQLNPGAAVAP
jgi:putative (di)nucleoside polyphosphate hydrolase